MKKIDWYILKKFLSSFFFCLLLFTIIAVVIDISEKTDDFVKAKLSAAQVFTMYYLGFIPYIDALLFPLFVFIGVLFFTSKMAGRSEIIAVLASGTSFNRLMRPYWIGGVLLAILLLLGSAFIVPQANARRTSFEEKYVDVNSTYDPLVESHESDVYFRLDSFTYAGVRSYDTSRKRGGPFFMNTVHNDVMTFNLRAESITWDTIKKTWKLHGIVKRTIYGMKETNVRVDDSLMKFNFKPFDLTQDEHAKDKLTTPELQQFINSEKLRGTEGLNTLQVEAYRRFATPVSVLILTLIGAVLASRKIRGGSGAHLAFGFVIAAVFILTDRFSTIFSTKGNFPPLIAAWLPNIIFLFVALRLYRKAPK